MREWDVAVIGAGAAGLMSAIAAARQGARTLLLEKNRRPGVKILMSGGTRCNITNARGLRSLRAVSGSIDPEYDRTLCRGARAITQAYGQAMGRFLGSSLRAFDVDATVQFFEQAGVATKVEGNGKIFPVSDRAADVLDALMRRLVESGAELRTLSPVVDLEAVGESSHRGFYVRAADGEFPVKNVILATGGQSFPGCGTTGDGYRLAARFGHTIIPPRPALVPIRVAVPWVKELSGLAVPDAAAVIKSAGKAILSERREAILFAHFGLTGPAILDVSREVARAENPEDIMLECDWIPGRKSEQLDAHLQSLRTAGQVPVAAHLDLPRRLSDALLAAARIPAQRMAPALTREERQRLVRAVKHCRLPVTGTLGFEKAEVTSGGVALDEVDPATLQSRKQPGLYLAGEVLDLDGPIGGYNFQAAWSTGWLAGEQAARQALLKISPKNL